MISPLNIRLQDYVFHDRSNRENGPLLLLFRPMHFVVVQLLPTAHVVLYVCY